MEKVDLEQVVKLARALGPSEQRRLRDWLNTWLERGQEEVAEDALDQEMLQEGVLDQVPPPITDSRPYQNWKPVDIQGKPLSETILEERR